MALTKPTNPHNNTSPNVLLGMDNYTDPITLAADSAKMQGLPKEVLDKVYTDVEKLVKNSWLGFLDAFNMNVSVKTNSIEFVESQTPDYVIDDDGAVTRSADVFSIDFTKVEGHETGEDAFFFRVNDTFIVVDDIKKENGIITAIDKSAGTFTAKTRNGSAWTVKTSNLSILPLSSDHDRGSCGPEGLMEQRKRKSKVLKLVIIKDAIKTAAGKRWKFTNDVGDVSWYDENTLALMRRLNDGIAKTLMLDIQSATGSAAATAGKWGTQGLFDNLEKNGLLQPGYITDVAGLEAITEYWETLGYENKEFIAHVDNKQFKYLEIIAGLVMKGKGATINVNLDNKLTNPSQFGFSTVIIDGYTIHFSKWSLTTGNSQLGKKRISEQMPKGIIMPMGEVETAINGVPMQVPYIFKVYQDMSPVGPSGMIRTYMDGAFNGQGTCEYSEISKSTTVGIAAPVPEAITIIK